MLPKALEDLVIELSKLPGIGPRTAERLAFYILRSSDQQALQLASTLENLHSNIQICERCFNLSEADLCAICSNAKRDSKIVAVVEDALDIVALEKTNLYRGLYHVLGGVLSPIDGVGPDQLHIKSLLERVDKGIEEIILATNATTEGEATALYIQRQLADSPVAVTRLARGLPVGSDLEYADQITLGRALEGRQAL